MEAAEQVKRKEKAADLREAVRQELRLLIGEAAALSGTLAEHPCPLGAEWLTEALGWVKIAVAKLEELHDEALAAAPPGLTSLGFPKCRSTVRPRVVR